MDLKNVMTTDPVVCLPSTPIDEVARLMRDNDIGEVPVVDDGKSMQVVGVVTDRDIVVRLLAAGTDALQSIVSDCMTSPAMTMDENATLEDCADLMASQQIRRVPIVDSNGAICGIVALADLERTNARRLKSEVSARVSQPH